MPSERKEIETLKNLIAEADHIVATLSLLPENRTARCRELLGSALVLTDHMLRSSRLPAAAALGHKGGAQTAKRGSEYFRQLAAKRKTHGGGRPRKPGDPLT
jgi:hypothetical protein